MPVTPEFGALLYVLARSSGARLIVEFGTSFGVSTLFLAAALRDNGGGRLVSHRKPQAQQPICTRPGWLIWSISASEMT